MRNKCSNLFIVCGCLAGMLLASQTGQAQQDGMHRVELLVVAYPSGGAGEQWEALPELAYPEAARYLMDPQDARSGSLSGGGSTTEPAAPLASAATGGLAPTGLPATYLQLPAGDREFGARAAAMRNSGRFRVLFHEAWVQPMSGQSAAVPIVLDDSWEGGAWPELQGTVTVYKSGDYLLATNLWLNTAGEYLPGAWRMPAPPRGPRPGTAREDAAGLPAAGLPANGSLDGETGAFADYPYRHAVLIQQTRKVRSGQPLYIDHPMLGVVVKVSSLDAPAAVPPAVGGETPVQANPVP